MTRQILALALLVAVLLGATRPAEAAKRYKVKVDSVPTGAKIYLETRQADPIGTTPQVFQLERGEYTFILEMKGYDGPKHFDAHAYRTEDERGVWAFADGCMRTYNILKEKAARFDEDPEVHDLLQEINALNPQFEQHLGKYTRKKAQAIKRVKFDIGRMGARGMKYERLDQLLAEILMGVR